jgi:hypothetical protein
VNLEFWYVLIGAAALVVGVFAWLVYLLWVAITGAGKILGRW